MDFRVFPATRFRDIGKSKCEIIINPKPRSNIPWLRDSSGSATPFADMFLANRVAGPRLGSC